MDHSISVTEQEPKFWKIGILLSTGLTILFFILFWQGTDPFLISIFRLSSFVFFAITVIGYLKVRKRPLAVVLSCSDKHLLVTYHHGGETVQEEQFDRLTVTQISTSHSGRDVISAYLNPSTSTFKIRFSDTDNELFLFECGGRPLVFEESSTKQINSFLESNHIRTKNEAC